MLLLRAKNDHLGVACR